jgi:hypothetical protein
MAILFGSASVLDDALSGAASDLMAGIDEELPLELAMLGRAT